MFPGLDLSDADPAQTPTRTGEELGDLDNDLSDLSVRRVHCSLTRHTQNCKYDARSAINLTRATVL